MTGNSLKMVQVAVGMGAEGDETVVAVDADGVVWEYQRAVEPHKTQYSGGTKATYRDGFSAGWRRLTMKPTEVLVHPEDPRFERKRAMESGS